MLTFTGRGFAKQVLSQHVEKVYPEKVYLFFGPRGAGKKFIAFNFCEAFGADKVYCDSFTVPDFQKLTQDIFQAVSGVFKFFILDSSSASLPAVRLVFDLIRKSPSQDVFIVLTSSLSQLEEFKSRAFTLELPVLSKQDFAEIFGVEGEKAHRFCGGLPGNFKYWQSGEAKEWVKQIYAFLKSPRTFTLKDTTDFSKFLSIHFEEKMAIWTELVISMDLPHKEFILEKTSEVLKAFASDPVVAATYLAKEIKIALINP